MPLAFKPARASSLYVPDEDLHLVPQLRTYLMPDKGHLPDPFHFTVSGLAPRTSPPSGWFSPSIHPTWPLRDLVMYAADPTSIASKPLPDTVQTSALMGSVFHVILNFAFRDMGILVPPPEKVCPLCRRPRGYKVGVDTCNETAVIDPVLRRRGHMDDVLNLPRLGSGIPVDVKTCAPHAIKHYSNHDDTPLTKPDATALNRKYYGQGQEYIDMYDAEKLLFIFVGMGSPWDMKEIVIYRDQPYIDAVKAKYALAREMAARGEIPPEA